ncbi:MAG TPA: NFACT RNA binding domain-containing protein [Candidatus Nanoarchaeia archaeon]|nr:NFACT RNA binding domain-containing protein [Candidatus Nanoarchaeia archaeon]
MQITLNLRKKLEQTANEYFEKSKKARKKTEGARAIILKFKKELEELERKQAAEEKKVEVKKTVPKEWYEKFRWFISSEGFLCIGGRDATTNEVIIKKHTDKDDIVFHTEAPGSPFFTIKTEGKKPTDITKKEVADATASYSKAWKLGLSAVEVYEIKPEQVSKKAPSGEYMSKGAFMITGKRAYHQGTIKLAVGKLPDERIMGGPETAVKANCKKYAVVTQGKDKPSDCAKKTAKYLEADIDNVLRVLPAGTCKITTQ